MVARFNSNGSLDQDFGIEGRVTYSASSNIPTGQVFVLADQRLVVTSYYSVMRLTSSGQLDTTFDNDGVASASGLIRSAARQSDGAIILGGTFNGMFGVKRLLADGLADSSFSFDGLAVSPMGNSSDTATHSAMQSDGRIIVVGSSQLKFAVAPLLELRCPRPKLFRRRPATD